MAEREAEGGMVSEPVMALLYKEHGTEQTNLATRFLLFHREREIWHIFYFDFL